MQVIFFDIRKPFLEDLYKHSVDRARMGHAVLGALDAALGDLASEAHTAVQPLLVRAMLDAAVAAVSRVLLDGGPNRCGTDGHACNATGKEPDHAGCW